MNYQDKANAKPKEDFDPKTSSSLFAVGDDCQAIYGFRGSRIEIILESFPRDFPEFTKIILNQNYRSTSPILNVAEEILNHNPKQNKKKLFTNKQIKTPVYYYLAQNEKKEAEYIIKQLKELYLNQNSNDDLKEESKQNSLQKLANSITIERLERFKKEQKKNPKNS